MTKKIIAYWIFTALTAVAIFGSGIMQFLKPAELVQNMTTLGFPLYIMTLMGTFKVAGALVLVAPGLPRLKEWAYAGIFINMVGGAYSHIAVDDPIGETVPVFVILVLSLTSWALRPDGPRKLEGPAL